jgi:hypothetical protein
VLQENEQLKFCDLWILKDPVLTNSIPHVERQRSLLHSNISQLSKMVFTLHTIMAGYFGVMLKKQSDDPEYIWKKKICIHSHYFL